ncbi:MAG TPA: exodeoxyribonuclease VII large subunit [Kamptonema sp.]|nr:exodeoxyribonuclease VII large subunit [Kamptonema sp.]
MTSIIPDNALSVAGVTSYIQALLEDDNYLHLVWVTGEVSNASESRSGLFFSLSDPDNPGMIRCVVWNSQRSQLMQMPVKGEQLIVLGSIRVYKARGEYQLNVCQALPAGEGLQALRYQQLRSRLETEGLFDPARKRSLPFHPQTVAVVTSPAAAAWGDIQRTFTQRYPGLHVLLSPASVQGELAAASITAAIERVESDGRAEVIILARGGGSVEDLACFNDERVVRAIANCSIPIITGIGHERDESLADLVADKSFHTPTAAAENVVPDLANLYIQHRQRVQTLVSVVEQRLHKAEQRCQQLQSRLKRLSSTSRSLQQATVQCQILRQKLATLDPQAVLQRGYAVVKQKDGTLARTTEKLVTGEELTIKLNQGMLKVKIVEIVDADD